MLLLRSLARGRLRQSSPFSPSLSILSFLPPVEHVERVSSLSGGRHLCLKGEKRSEEATEDYARELKNWSEREEEKVEEAMRRKR
jgi:hypothetical protein